MTTDKVQRFHLQMIIVENIKHQIGKHMSMMMISILKQYFYQQCPLCRDTTNIEQIWNFGPSLRYLILLLKQIYINSLQFDNHYRAANYLSNFCPRVNSNIARLQFLIPKPFSKYSKSEPYPYLNHRKSDAKALDVLHLEWSPPGSGPGSEIFILPGPKILDMINFS